MRSAWELGNIPLTVLTAGQDEWEPGFPPDVAARYERLWLTLQDELANRSRRHRQIVVAESGHCIHDDAPQVLLDAIREMIANARRPLP
jgi:pimeloyl-ACP methyl ester carboxylesterase